MQVEKHIQRQVLLFVAAVTVSTIVMGVAGFVLSRPVPKEDVNVSRNVCTRDLKACADGTLLSRDAKNNCQFPVCPEPGITPPADVITCCGQPDWRSCRNPQQEQQGVEACQQEGCAACQADLQGSSSSSGASSVTSSKSTSLVACTQEAALCADGSYVGRNSANNCAFDPCPDGSVPGSGVVPTL